MHPPSMNLDEWDFDLPKDRIARHPVPQRDASRLMVLERDGGPPEHRRFRDLTRILRPGDLLVANDTRVMAARLEGRRDSGGKLEVLLLEPGPGPVRCMIRNARRLKTGERFELGGRHATLRERLPDGLFLIDVADAAELMEQSGALPIPPYLGRAEVEADRERYQTVFAGPLGAAAAPTAGLHFTPRLIETLRQRGIGFSTVTLHVGLGTFRPLRPEDLERGELHPEPWVLPAATARAIANARSAGGRIIAVGTTSARTLESAPDQGPSSGITRLFLHPGRPPRVIDGLITNFHLPRSSLLMLVAALVGRDRLLAAYREAIEADYRFYSYGDAMLLL